ncbi:MAG: hypothetical protein ABI885_23940 [Gammaproteobacteria bacterium]
MTSDRILTTHVVNLQEYADAFGGKQTDDAVLRNRFVEVVLSSRIAYMFRRNCWLSSSAAEAPEVSGAPRL